MVKERLNSFSKEDDGNGAAKLYFLLDESVCPPMMALCNPLLAALFIPATFL